jgi:hypothetical protein
MLGMKISLELTAQARQKTGQNIVQADVTDGACPLDALCEIIDSRLPEVRQLVFDEQHQLASGWMLLVNGKLLDAESQLPLNDRDTLTLLAPLGGG